MNAVVIRDGLAIINVAAVIAESLDCAGIQEDTARQGLKRGRHFERSEENYLAIRDHGIAAEAGQFLAPFLHRLA